MPVNNNNNNDAGYSLTTKTYSTSNGHTASLMWIGSVCLCFFFDCWLLVMVFGACLCFFLVVSDGVWCLFVVVLVFAVSWLFGVWRLFVLIADCLF